MLWRRKHLIPVLIILFWLVMMGILIYREAIIPRMYHGLASRRIDMPQSLSLGLYFGEDQQVGYINLHTTPEERAEEKGYALNASGRVEFPLFGQETRLQVTGTAWMSAVNGLREFDFQLNAGEHDMRIVGTVQEGMVDAALHTAGEKIPFKLPVGRELLLSGSLGLNAASLPRLLPGEVAFVDAFDPTTMSVGRAKIEALRYETLEVAGEPMETIVVATTISGITTRAWISQEEEIIRAETPFGLILKRMETQDLAIPLHPDKTADMVRALAIKPSGSNPDPDAAALRLRITGIDEKLMPPQDTRQSRSDGAWLIVRQNPEDTSLAEPFSGGDMDAYLGSDMFVQTAHPRIQTLAKQIAGDAGAP